jgi:hypothetical protein
LLYPGHGKAYPISYSSSNDVTLHSVGMELASIRFPTTRFLDRMGASPIPTEERSHFVTILH